MIYIDNKTDEILTPCCNGNGKYLKYIMKDDIVIYVCDECEKIADSLTDVAYSIYSDSSIWRYYDRYLNKKFSKNEIIDIHILKKDSFNLELLPHKNIENSFNSTYYLKILTEDVPKLKKELS